MKLLSPKFYQQDTVTVAQALLGKRLVRVLNGAYIVSIISETESYTIDDPASHSYRGKTERNAAMFGPVGHAYVYVSYGMHYCFNVVARAPHVVAGGALIRELIPEIGKNLMLQQRPVAEKILCNGPGKLTQACAISLEHNGTSLMNSEGALFIIEGDIPEGYHIVAGPRIGISVATEKLWRFTLVKK